MEFSFPLLEFPSYTPAGLEGVRRPQSLGDRPSQFNTVEYGRLSAMTEQGGRACYRQMGRDNHVCYLTPCLPLIPPNPRTPYDMSSNVHRGIGMKHRVLKQVTYLQTNFRSLYIPVETLCSELQTANTMEDQYMEFDGRVGSLVSFLPYDLVGCHGCLFYASGANLETLSVGLLLDPPGELHLQPVEGHHIPGRVREVQALRTQDRGLVCVRSDYHVAFFEAPLSDQLMDIVKQYGAQDTPRVLELDVTILQCLAVFKTDVCTSSVKLCPYIAGEALLITETGGIYHWSQDEGLNVIQTALTMPTLSSPTHFWQCCYGAHPRSLVLAEHTGLSLGDFRSGQLLFKPLLTQPSEVLPESAVISAISPHPVHPFHLVVATSESLVLLDTRQPHTPMLAMDHECPDPPRFISTLYTNNDTLVLLSSQLSAEPTVYMYSGGSGLPPFFRCLPHIAASYREFGAAMSQQPLMHYVGDRLKQPLAGSCLFQLKNGQHFAAVTISSLGDVFFQTWTYQKEVTSLAPPLASSELWIREAWRQEQELLAHQDHPQGTGYKDFRPLVDYITSSESTLCFQCYSMAKTNFTEIDISSSINKLIDGTRCAFCGHKFLLSRRLKTLQDSGEKTSGLESLREVCGVGESHTGLDRRLWEGWREEEEQQIMEEEAVAMETAAATPVQGHKSQPMSSKRQHRSMGF